MALDLDAVVLAGGLGTRLKDVLPEGCPKVMAMVDGRPFIETILERLQGQGVGTVVFSLGYGARHVIDYLAARKAPKELAVRWVVEPAPLGTGGALAFAFAEVRSDPFIAFNGDSYWNVDLPRLVSFHRERRAAITLALARVPDARRYGRVECDAGGKVTRFIEKDDAAGPGLISCGLYVISRAAMDGLERGKAFSWERDVLARRVGEGLYAREAADQFLDIGTPDSLSAAPALMPRKETTQ